jgi:hypothetical protein
MTPEQMATAMELMEGQARRHARLFVIQPLKERGFFFKSPEDFSSYCKKSKDLILSLVEELEDQSLKTSFEVLIDAEQAIPVSLLHRATRLLHEQLDIRHSEDTVTVEEVFNSLPFFKKKLFLAVPELVNNEKFELLVVMLGVRTAREFLAKFAIKENEL